MGACLGSSVQPAPAAAALPPLSFNIHHRVQLSDGPLKPFLFKVALVGNPIVGKSYTLLRYVDPNTPVNDETLGTTIGSDFKIVYASAKRTDNNETCYVKLQIWDLAGGIRFRAMTAASLSGTQTAIVFFSLQDRSSFDSIRLEWYPLLQKHHVAAMVLVGVSSSPSHPREVTPGEAAELCAEIGAKGYCEVAQDIEGIDAVFALLCTGLLNKELKRGG